MSLDIQGHLGGPTTCCERTLVPNKVFQGSKCKYDLGIQFLSWLDQRSVRIMFGVVEHKNAGREKEIRKGPYLKPKSNCKLMSRTAGQMSWTDDITHHHYGGVHGNNRPVDLVWITLPTFQDRLGRDMGPGLLTGNALLSLCNVLKILSLVLKGKFHCKSWHIWLQNHQEKIFNQD